MCFPASQCTLLDPLRTTHEYRALIGTPLPHNLRPAPTSAKHTRVQKTFASTNPLGFRRRVGLLLRHRRRREKRRPSHKDQEVPVCGNSRAGNRRVSIAWPAVSEAACCHWVSFLRMRGRPFRLSSRLWCVSPCVSACMGKTFNTN